MASFTLMYGSFSILPTSSPEPQVAMGSAPRTTDQPSGKSEEAEGWSVVQPSPLDVTPSSYESDWHEHSVHDRSGLNLTIYEFSKRRFSIYGIADPFFGSTVSFLILACLFNMLPLGHAAKDGYSAEKQAKQECSKR